MIVQSGVPTAITLERRRPPRRRGRGARSASQTCRALRDVPGDAILAAQVALESRRGGRMVFIPCVDGAVVEQPPIDALAAGAAAGIPMMIGTNVDELRLMSAGDPHRGDLDADGLRRRLDKLIDGAVDEVIDARHAPRSGARRSDDTERSLVRDRVGPLLPGAVDPCGRRARARTSRARSSTCSAGPPPRSTAGSARATCSRSRSCSASTTAPHLAAFTGAGPRPIASARR